MRPLSCANAPVPVSAELLTEEGLVEAGSIAPLTAYGYASDWKAFTAWCASTQRKALPATENTVSGYLIDRLNCGYKINTAARHLSAIRYYHLRDGFPSPYTPRIYGMLLGAKRLRCERLDRRAPLTVEQLRQILAGMTDQRALTIRNRAVLLFAFATALRRSSICFLDLEDLQWASDGLVVAVRREKQDQFGHGRQVAVPFGSQAETCPLVALRAWLEIRGGQAGPLFTQTTAHGRKVTLLRMDSQSVYRAVKCGVARIGLDPKRFGSHSTRAGFVTTAIENGARDVQVAQQTGHRSLASLRRYYRPESLFEGNACAALGL